MHEDLIREIEDDKKMGLELSDTAYYNVDDGVTDEPLIEDVTVTENDERRSGIKPGIIILLSFMFGVIVSLAGLALCTHAFDAGRFVTNDIYDYYVDLDKSYGKYYEIMKMIGEDPIATADPEEISDAELKEIVSNIGDPYAVYYTASEYAEIEKRYMGDFIGVGIMVTMDDDKNIVIMSVIEDTPAAEAGIKAEDIIVKVDGKKPADVDDAVQMITGEAGTKVKITVRRGDETIDFDLLRQKIETDSVAYDVLEDHPEIGYINITSFIKGTDDEFKSAVKELEAKGCTRFILDLRDNGGGLTDPSIEIADYLLPACKIMSESTKDGSETIHNSDASSADLDMVILVNGNTASASEILAAALQDNKAGTVIGTKTYGKGVTQILQKFSDGTAVKLTVTEYFRPNGKTVNGIGITPDIEAEGEEVLDEALRELGQ